MKRSTVILRWLVALPAAIVVFVLVIVIANLIFTYSGRDEEGSYPITSLLAPGIAGLIAAYAFVYVGFAIAPSHKKQFAFSLFVIMCLGCLSGVYLMVSHSITYDYKTILVTIGQFIGSVIVYLQIKRDEILD